MFEPRENKAMQFELEDKAREGRRLYMKEYRESRKEEIKTKTLEYWARKAEEYKNKNMEG